MNRNHRPISQVLFFFAACTLPATVPAGDWPQFRYDAARTAASPEQLPAALHLQWVRRLPAPRPAFANEIRLLYDASYEPVVADGILFVPSMVADSVTALDVQTGAQRWRFFAEGPVRFAPVVWEGGVYFVSDDGYLYCLNAADGTLRWKFRGWEPGQRDRHLLGHGRLISLWPARGGPVIDQGVLYFGAGLWSAYGVAVHALDARSGRPLWSNVDSDRIPRANMDHGIANVAGLTPHGYLTLVNQMLVVPCGAQLPAFLDPHTGRLQTAYTMGWGGRVGLPKGTWFAAGTGKYLSQGGDLYDTTRTNDEHFPDLTGIKSEIGKRPEFKSMLYAGAFTRVRIDPTNHKDLGDFSQPVLTATELYESVDGAVKAFDLAGGEMVRQPQPRVVENRGTDPFFDNWKMRFPETWRLSSELKVHIKAGDRLYLGGGKTVAAVRIPQLGQQPEIEWQTKIDGTPQRMLAACGQLFVVSREGTIYAFGDHRSGDPIVHESPVAPAPQADEWTRTVADMLAATGPREGYALVLGIRDGRLVEELLRQSNLNVIGIDSDAERIAALRERLDRGGLYGARASLHVGDPLSYPLPPYLAALIVSERWAEICPTPSRAAVAALIHSLRPYGGTACLAAPVASHDLWKTAVGAAGIAGAAVDAVGDWLLVSRNGSLPGSADWTHAEADAANTGASEDDFVQGPLDMLWFDAPRRWLRPRDKAMVRVCAGRLFVKDDRLCAIDVFTGRRLWDISLPTLHSPDDQFVATAEALYLAAGDTCLVLDPATGRETSRIELPPDLSGAWRNLRICEDLLVVQAGKQLVCLDRHSRQLVWKHELAHARLSVAVGNGRLFCAELASKRRGEDPLRDSKTTAFDLQTGAVLWEVRGGSNLRYSRAADMLIMTSGVYRATDGRRVGQWPSPAEDAGLPTSKSDPQALFVVGSQAVYGTADSFMLYDLAAGRTQGDVTTWIRRGCTVPRASAHFVTTRVLGNAAVIDLATRETSAFGNVRAACCNNLYPADGVLNMPSMTGGCSCNYLPVSQAFVPSTVLPRMADGPVAN